MTKRFSSYVHLYDIFFQVEQNSDTSIHPPDALLQPWCPDRPKVSPGSEQLDPDVLEKSAAAGHQSALPALNQPKAFRSTRKQTENFPCRKLNFLLLLRCGNGVPQIKSEGKKS